MRLNENFNFSEVAFFRLPFFRGTPSAAVFEDINKRFFATDRKKKNLELGRDGFFIFDPYPEIFEISAKNRPIFEFGARMKKWFLKIKNVI